MNQVNLLGRLCADPELKGSDQVKVINFSVATNEKGYTTKAGKVIEDSVDFHACTCFGYTATYLKNFGKKGNMVNVRGKLKQGKYVNKDGNEVHTTSVVVDEMNILFPPKAQSQDYNAGQQQNNQNTYQQPQVNRDTNVSNNREPMTSPRQNNNNQNDLPF